MTLSAAARRRINRANAQNSTGPTSEAGKSRSRSNALKHGLRAQVVALPGEDPAAVQARADSWNDYYQPRDPAEQHLVNRAVAATLLSDRVDTFHAAQLAKQVRDASADWDRNRDAVAAEIAGRLGGADPAAAVADLRTFVHGIRLLIDRWEALGDRLRERGRWSKDECHEAVRLAGAHPSRLTESRDGYLLAVYGLSLRAPGSDELCALLAHDRQPPSLPAATDRDFVDPATCLSTLQARVAGRVAELEAREQDLAADDEADRAEAGDRALILLDGATARLFLRYHAEARTAFQRAYAALVQERRLDKESGPSEGAAAVEKPAAAVVETTAAVVPPNEPNRPEPSPEPVDSEEVEEDDDGLRVPPDGWSDEQKALIREMAAAEAEFQAFCERAEAEYGIKIDDPWLAEAV